MSGQYSGRGLIGEVRDVAQIKDFSYRNHVFSRGRHCQFRILEKRKLIDATVSSFSNLRVILR